MASTTSRGNYYKKSTQKWFEARGYTVQLTEFVSSRPIGGGRMIWTKKDVFSSDGIAMNGEEIIFWNAKHCSTNDKNNIDTQVRQGRKEFAQHPFPPTVKRQLFMWEPRKQPVIIDCI